MFDADGQWRYRKVFIGIPRKQGKTELVAAIKLYLMFGSGKRGQKIFSTRRATQSRRLWSMACRPR